MKRITFIFLIILGFGCSERQQSNANHVKSINDTILSIQKDKLSEKQNRRDLIDTIPERNNPNSLDLSKHQLFIDTTRNSQFYDKLINWSASKWSSKSINSMLKEINNGYQPKPIDFKNFPTHFIKLRKLNGEFVLYQRCDGIDQRYEIRDTAFITYGPLEPDAATILKLIYLSDNKIKLELKVYNPNPAFQKSILTIKKINNKIYKMSSKNGNFDGIEYLTTFDKIKDFDLVVNHCLQRKMLEFEGFDKR